MVGVGLFGDVLTLVRRGVVGPALPHRTAGQLASILAYGMGLFGELRQAAKRSPGALAVIDEERGESTYAELLAQVEITSEVLHGHGVRPGDRVGLLARNHVAAVETMAAVDALGADLVLLNTGLTPPQLSVVASEQRLSIVVHDDELAAAVSGLTELTRVSESEVAEAVAHTSRPVFLRPQRGGRTIVLTSGTTGSPKGATRRTPPSIAPLAAILERIPFNSGERVLISAPIFHTWGFAALQLAFGIRATVVLQRRFDPAAARAALEEHQVHAHVAVPVMLHRMMELPSDPGARHRRSLRLTATSGSALPGGLATAYMNEYGDILHNLYGSTEASWVSIAGPKELRRSPQTAGLPPRGTTVRILDRDGREVPQGTVGRIFCGNELVFEGYTAGPGKEFVDGLISTGDLGCVRDGLLFVEGREDDMVISGGENVYPDEVTSALDLLAGVRECAVVGVQDETFGQRLAAFVVRMPGASLSEADVVAHCKANVSRHAVPRDVHFLDELPRNATGKILSLELRERASG
ncbi:MAG: AMP-binding protein [Dermatophilaceae bacterium]